MAIDTYTRSFAEILTQVSKMKTKKEKVSFLRQYQTDALRMICKASFDPKIEWVLPEGDVPYTVNDAPEGTEHTLLQKEVRRLYHFIKGGNPALKQNKREMMFVQMLEGLHKDEAVLLVAAKDKKLQVLDIGTGSGCILLSILKERSNFYGTGIDISKKSINVSKFNAKQLNLMNKVKFFNSSVDNFKIGKYDLIVSNPPYIELLNLKYLEKDVVNFEPKLALSGGLDGFSKIRKVINKANTLIKKNGKFILEIGFNQKNKVKKILKEEGFYINKTIKDYGNNDRCIISTKI